MSPLAISVPVIPPILDELNLNHPAIERLEVPASISCASTLSSLPSKASDVKALNSAFPCVTLKLASEYNDSLISTLKAS